MAMACLDSFYSYSSSSIPRHGQNNEVYRLNVTLALIC
jgi:hypothetical protein